MIIEELKYSDPLYTYEVFAPLVGTVFLDGGQRYSFIGIDPFEILSDEASHPFLLLQNKLKEFPLETIPNLPPFQGGAMGYWGYDLCAKLETIRLQAKDLFSFPDMIIGLYDLVIAYDHAQQRSWLISSGYPEQHQELRKNRANKRIKWVLNTLEKTSKKESYDNKVFEREEISSNFTEAQYCSAVKKVIDYILNGDVFETNIAQRFQLDLPDDFSSIELYHRLRTINKAPFSSFLNWGDYVIASASPERFLSLKSGVVETKPIKGTLPRGCTPDEDKRLANELLASEKDKAENVMIVDLMRNDLSKVCLPDSVVVEKLCALESFPSVHHLVSTIRAKLLPTHNAVDLLAACFPGGSITGAPKVRSMEIISEIEPHRRGAYCGSIGYIGFNGDMDTSITIRTFAINKNKLSFHAGGAVVLDSDPGKEYQETWDKVRGMIDVLTQETVGA